MPKRSLDTGTMSPMGAVEKTQRKTERSHEENQERAYIAASRRADRSIEARVQSARMASEIHKKRTGKGFRISEEIVVKEEMYEEEEDEFPRSYRLLHPNLQTASPEMNFRVEAYLTNRMAMSAMVARTNEEWKANEINRLFDQSFPNAGKQAEEITRRMSKSAHSGGQGGESNPASPMSPGFQPVNYQPDHGQQQIANNGEGGQIASPAVASVSDPASASNPVSPTTQPASSFGGPVPQAPPMAAAFGSEQSAFTAELPPEARMLMGMDMTGADWNPNIFGQGWENEQLFAPADMTNMVKMEPTADLSQGFFGDDSNTPMKWNNMEQPGAPMDEPSWDSFLDDEVWAKDQ